MCSPKINENELVPPEIWGILDKSIKCIAKNKNGKINCFVSYPTMKRDGFHSDYFYYQINFLSILENAKIRDIDWKESLCVRPDEE